jgi:soluble lytic murein transglycosylase-like protein
MSRSLRRRGAALAIASLAFVGVACTPNSPTKAQMARSAQTRSCPQYDHLLRKHGMPVSQFSRIMFKESSCRPAVRSRTRDTGLLQINDINHQWLSRKLGTRVTIAWLKYPENNVRAAAALYRAYGTNPWRATR